MKSALAWLVVAGAAGVGGFALGQRGQSAKETGADVSQKVHELKKPLRIATANAEQHLELAAGTLLYFDKHMDEGFDRYHVYINVPSGLPLAEPDKPGLIAPLSGFFDEPKKP